MRLKILGAAMDDLYDGHRFYERQGSGLGAYFFECLFTDIDALHIHAGIHPLRFGYHRMLSKRFPYAIYYATEQDEILVRRVLDTRRNPAHIQRALE